jgi:hypothetical protein
MKIRTMFLLLTSLGAAQHALGYEIRTCGGDKIQWDGTPRFRASEVGFPDGHARTAALRTIVDRWNHSPAAFRFNLTWNEEGVSLGNGQNEVWFTGDPDVLDGKPAIAFNWDDCGDFGFGDGDSEIEEKDVVFACDAAWTGGCAATYPNPVRWYFGTNTNEMRPYGGTQRSFRTTAMHEFGHGLGLKHEDEEYNIMGSDETHIHANGNTGTAYPGEDASDGAERLYGASAETREDLGVVHWRYRAPNGNGYSSHERTGIFDANDVEIFDGRVNPGQRIRVEFSFENNGSTAHYAVPVRYFLSSDTLLDQGDRLLATASPDLLRNRVYTRRQTIDLPGNLVAGATYFIIAVVDSGNTIFEIYEDNNTTFSKPLTVQ